MNTGRANTGMYTGTVIRDLITAVERAERRAEQRAEQQRITEELQAIFSLEGFAMQIPLTDHDPVLTGAA